MTTPSESVYATITLTQGYVTIVDLEDFEKFGHLGWFAQVCRKNGKILRVYARMNSMHRGKGHSRHAIFLHREIVGAVGREIEVDHWDHDGLNNRRSNLRVGSKNDNQHNLQTPSHNTSGFKGVSKQKQYKNCERWVSYITHNKKRIYLGIFSKIEDAARTYDRKAIELFGEFAHTNFPRSDYD